MNHFLRKYYAFSCCLLVCASQVSAAESKELKPTGASSSRKNSNAESTSSGKPELKTKDGANSQNTAGAENKSEELNQLANMASDPHALDSRPEIKRLDAELRDFLNRWSIPCVSITVSYKGKILLSRGIGIADWSKRELASSKNLFRLASISKSLTAMGTLLLVQQGKLGLDQKAFEVLKDLKPCNPDFQPDPRLKQITIRNLLECSAGWNQDVHGDPMFGAMLNESALNCSRSLRPTATSIIRYLINDRLDFNPGTDYQYSNSCYIVLGKIIEKVSGTNYYEFITKNLLEPMNLSGIKPGGTLERQRLPDEVRYYADSNEKSNSMLPNVRGPLSIAYGGYFVLESAPGSIGWVASSEDLVKLVDIISGESTTASPLNPKMTEIMLERPKIECWKNSPEYFAKGWEVSKDQNGNLIYFSRHGSLPGSMALVEHQSNGLSWSAVFNFRPRSYVESREQVTGLIKTDLAALMPYLQSKYGKLGNQ